MSSRSDVIRLYSPPSECGDELCNDRFSQLLEFIYCVGVPGAVVVIMLIILMRIMCCNSKRCCSCGKYNTLSGNADEMQMDTYNSIRRASATVRQMSHNRETALMGSRAGSMTLDRPHRRPDRRAPRTRDACHSAPGTLQRRQRYTDRDSTAEPPAYIEPPAYSSVTDQHKTRRSRQNRYSDQPAPPPPPPYSMHSDDVFLGPDILEAESRSAQPVVRYEESPEQNDSGQPLLAPSQYDRDSMPIVLKTQHW